MRSERTLGLLIYIGANVRKFRIQKGMTQEKLAEAVDLDVRYLQRVEGGVVNLSVDVLGALADVLGVEPSRLLRRTTPAEKRIGRPRKRVVRRKP